MYSPGRQAEREQHNIRHSQIYLEARDEDIQKNRKQSFVTTATRRGSVLVVYDKYYVGAEASFRQLNDQNMIPVINKYPVKIAHCIIRH